MKSVPYAVLAAMLAVPLPATAQMRIDLELDVVHHDNLGRSRWVADRKDDASTAWFAEARYEPALQTVGVVNVHANAGIEAYSRHSGFNRRAAGAGVSHFRRLGLGPQAPWLRARLDLDYQDFNERARDGFGWQAETAVGRMLGERLEGTLRLAYREHDGRGARGEGRNPQRVFDTHHVRVDLEVDFFAGERVSVFGGIGWLDGLVNTWAATEPFPASGPWLHSAALGEGYRAYRIAVDAWRFRTGIAVAFGRDTHAELSWESIDAETRTGADYRSGLFLLRVRHGL